MKNSLILVGGGDAFDTHEEYLTSLGQMPWAIAPYAWQKKRWRVNIADKYRVLTDVYMPELPCKQNAKYREWKLLFDQLASGLNEKTIYVGHSLGANFLAKYFYESGKRGKTLHLVAGCYGLGGGFDLPNDLSVLHNQFDTVHLWQSTDDMVVGFGDFQKYKNSLPKAIPHVFDDRGHFSIETFPELEELIAVEIDD